MSEDTGNYPPRSSPYTDSCTITISSYGTADNTSGDVILAFNLSGYGTNWPTPRRRRHNGRTYLDLLEKKRRRRWKGKGHGY